MMDQVTYLHMSVGQRKYYRPCYSVFACSGPYATQAGAEPIMNHDSTRARQLVKESGYDGRPVVVIRVTDFPFLDRAALVTRQRLESIGFNGRTQGDGLVDRRRGPRAQGSARQGRLEHPSYVVSRRQT